MTQKKWQDTLVSSERTPAYRGGGTFTHESRATSHESRATSHESLYNKTITTKGYPAHAAYT